MTNMTQKVIHNTEGNPLYKIVIAEDFSFFPELLAEVASEKRKLCIVADSKVFPLYGETLSTLLREQSYQVFSFVFPSGEESKQLRTVEQLYEFLILHSFDRKDMLLALGGGVTGDLTGYAAATYLRGIRFVGVPTSLLSMVDSSIGGKTGVDFQAYKNMVGAFYQPLAVYINLSTLRTLPSREFVAGMGEVIKHGMIKDKDYFAFLSTNANQIRSMEPSVLREMIYQSLCIKGDVVERDPKEQGERALLNFGHTIGHAIEKMHDFRLLHGECVLLGALCAAWLSLDRGMLSSAELEAIYALYALYDIPTDITAMYEKYGLEGTSFGGNVEATMDQKARESNLSHRDRLLSICHHDKKANGTHILFVLLQRLGEAVLVGDVTDDEIRMAYSHVYKEDAL